MVGDGVGDGVVQCSAGESGWIGLVWILRTNFLVNDYFVSMDGYWIVVLWWFDGMKGTERNGMQGIRSVDVRTLPTTAARKVLHQPDCL